jgi:peptidoglycan/LPS O-acetylase OafA/YrhL
MTRLRRGAAPREAGGTTSGGSASRHYRFATLDAMRGLGAIGVMIYHGSLGLFVSGFPAVDFFYVFSGFVFGYAYTGLLDRQATFGQFAAIRLIRLYPLYLAGLVIGVVVSALLMHFGDDNWWPSRLALATVTNAVFLPYLSDSAYGAYPLNVPAWTMFFELAVNAIFAWKRFSMRGNVAVALIALPFLVWSLYAFPGGGGSTPRDFVGGFPRALFSFYVGIVISQLQAADRLPKGLVPALAFPAVMLVMYLSPIAAVVVGAVLVITVIQPVLGALAVESEAPRRLMPIFYWLGDISYAVYIIHFPIQQLTDALIKVATHRGVDTDTSPYTLLVSTPVVILLAHILTRYFDAPLRRRLTRAVMGRARSATGQAA